MIVMLTSSSECRRIFNLMAYGLFWCTVLPIMSEPPTVTSLTSSDVTLSWPTWYSALTTHQGPIVVIDSYVVQMLSNTSSATASEWTGMGSVAANKLNTSFGPYTFTVGGLQPGAFYSFRLIILWLSNGKVSSSPPGPPTEWIGVLCGKIKLAYYYYYHLFCTWKVQ